MTQLLATEFAAIARQLHDEEGVDATLERILALACTALEADWSGVMVVHRGRRIETAAATDELVRRADELQVECDEGPCLESLDDHATYLIDDTATEERWPLWCRRVAELGVRSVLSVRLYTQQSTIGSLNVYSGKVGHFHDDAEQLAAILGGHASVALAAARTESGLREAMEGRHVIGLAQGILMERFELDQERAFAVLRRYSQDSNVKLRQVAQRLVQTRSLPG